MKIDEEELKTIGNFYLNVPKTKKNSKWGIIYDLENKEYLKIYSKKELFEDIVVNDYIDFNYNFHLINFFKSGKYNFLPQFKFETKNYIVFKYYNNYTQVKIEDLLDLSHNKLNLLFKINKEENNHKPTIFFKSIIKDLKKMYLNEKIDIEFPKELKELICLKTTSKSLNYLTITPSDINIHDIMVKKDKNNKIIDWKYVDFDNIEIYFPRYIFNFEPCAKYPVDNRYEDVRVLQEHKQGGHDVLNLKDINDITDKPSILLSYNYKWYNLGEIEKI